MADVSNAQYILDGTVIDGWRYRGNVPYEKVPDPKDVVYIVAPETFGFDKIRAYEEAINHRYFHLGKQYIVLPYGSRVPGEENKDVHPVVRCSHCGGWAAYGTACVHCGAPVV